jgi:hypothetical protein
MKLTLTSLSVSVNVIETSFHSAVTSLLLIRAVNKKTGESSGSRAGSRTITSRDSLEETPFPRCVAQLALELLSRSALNTLIGNMIFELAEYESLQLVN